MTAMDRYLARLMAVPFISTMILSALLLVLDRMQKLLSFVAAEGGPVSVIWRMLGSLIPEYLSLGVIIGLLLSIVLTFRKLALSSELDVLTAVGVSYSRMLRVPYIYAVAVALVSFAIVGYIQPVSRFNYERLRYDLRTGALGASIRTAEFNQVGKNIMLRVESASGGGKRLHGLFLKLIQKDGRNLIATAKEGTFLATPSRDEIILRLISGSIVISNASGGKNGVLTFDRHDLVIPLPGGEAFRSRGEEKSREYTMPELVTISQSTSDDEQRNGALSQLHFRLVQVAASLVVPLLAIALAIPPKRSSSALGVFLAIVIVVAYYKVNEYAASIASLGTVNAAVALWVPFVIFFMISLRMYYTLAFTVGGQPIASLERGGSVVMSWARKLWK